MKKMLTLLFILSITQISIPQQLVTDVSPDGLLTNTYAPVPGDIIISNYQDVPFGNAPSWISMRERQIGGLAFGDYDSDGDLDLAVGCYFSQSYPPINEYENFIFRNDNGVLDTVPAWITSDERSTTDIRWADVNMDGIPDLLSANGNFQKSTLYLNSDSGLSNIPAWISNDNVFTVGAAFCDIDGDGDLDLALANQGISPDAFRPIQMFYNNNGSLSSSPSWSSADQMITNSLAFADIDNSSLAFHNINHTASGNAYTFFIPMTPVYSIDTVKVDGVVVSNYSFNPLNCWIALGYKPSAGAQVSISYTYINKGDMAGAKWANFESGIYYNNNGLMNTSPGWTVGHTQTQKGIAWADIDLDGYMDLAIGGSGMPANVYKNNNGIISSVPYWASNSSSTSTQDLIWGDVNRDGYPDLALIHFGYKRVEIFINRGGILDSDPTWAYATSSSATTIAFGDVNGDGWLDLAVGTAREPVMLFIADPSLVPVELISLTAVYRTNKIHVQWETSTEKNNYGFELERKIETINSSSGWDRIAFIPGNGTSSEKHSYLYEDNTSGNGRYSYRLKQIDLDGTSEYSKTISTDVISVYSLNLEQNYPNPFNPQTKIRYQIPDGSFVNIKLFDILGREIAVLINEFQAAGEYEINLKADELKLSSGVYFYSLDTRNIVLTKKLILSR